MIERGKEKTRLSEGGTQVKATCIEVLKKEEMDRHCGSGVDGFNSHFEIRFLM